MVSGSQHASCSREVLYDMSGADDFGPGVTNCKKLGGFTGETGEPARLESTAGFQATML
jgi:hypothetical protein